MNDDELTGAGTAEGEALMRSARALRAPSHEAVGAYREQGETLVAAVDAAMEKRPDIGALIGDNPLRVMRDNHRNHHKFMLNVFALGRYELLVRTLPWVYRAYGSHGFRNDYFPAVLKAWVEAIAAHLAPGPAGELYLAYRWMLEQHETIERLARSGWPPTDDEVGRVDAEVEQMVGLLTTGDFRACLTHARERVRVAVDIPGYYVRVLQPALVEIGRRWERDELSVAEEHLATGVAGRVMAMLYGKIAKAPKTLGRAVVSCSAGELHEVGARMAADLLELDGWEVTFIGADVPAADLLQLLRGQGPVLLAVSVTMPFNLNLAAELVRSVKGDPELSNIRVAVGGRAVRQLGEEGDLLGADGTARDAVQLVELARRWWNG